MTPKQKASEPWIILPGTTVGGEVGTFSVDFTIWNQERTESRTLRGLVDTGASYTMVPDSILSGLGIEPFDREAFRLADGSRRELSLGWVYIELDGRIRPTYVIFGSDDNNILLGAMALEAFGLAADARYRRLISAELTL